jgi:hypothetical protein
VYAHATVDTMPAPTARRTRVRSRTLVVLALSCGVSALTTLALGPGAPASAKATLARSISVKDEGYLRFVKSSGSLLIDEGSAHGTIPGTVRIGFLYNGDPNVSAQITIHGHTGAILARASGRLSNPTSSSPSFSGTLTISGGSGRYTRANGSGRLYGVFYRRSYAMTVQTEGTLHY